MTMLPNEATSLDGAITLPLHMVAPRCRASERKH